MHERRPRVQAPQITRFAYKCALALTQEAMTRDRRKAWRWTPPDGLAELKALEVEDDEMSQPSTAKRAKRPAA